MGWRDAFGSIKAAGRIAWAGSPRWLMAVLFGTVVSGVAPLVSVILTRDLLNEIQARRAPTSSIVGLAAALGLIAVALGGLGVAVNYAQARLRRATYPLTQRQLFSAVNAAPGLDAFETPRFHDELRLAQYMGQEAPAQLLGLALSLTQSLITVVGFVGELFAFGAAIVGALVLGAVPALVIDLKLSSARVRTAQGAARLSREQFFFAGLLADVQAAREIRIFELGKFLLGKMDASLRDRNALENSLDRRQSQIQGLGIVVEGLVTTACLAYVAFTASARGLQAGDIALFIGASVGLQGSIGTISRSMIQGQQALANFTPYRRIVERAVSETSRANQVAVASLQDALSFEDVWYRYGTRGAWALRGLNLALRPGRVVALVGENGAGKSTVVRLACAFDRPSHGQVSWDSIDYANIELASLRRRMAAVFQDFMAYPLTARENIGIGRLDVLTDTGSLRQAARLAGIEEAIDRLPSGFDTRLTRMFSSGADSGEEGQPLSGGQWQRLAIARALVKESADVLILDEPSSGLDPEAEALLARNVLKARNRKAVLLVTQRLGALRWADEIIVLVGGSVVERGSHSELMHVDGEYARMFRLQASGYVGEEVL